MSTSPVRSFLLAWHFLTIVRLRRTGHEATPQELSATFMWFPFIGLLLGGMLVMIDQGCSQVFSRIVVDLILIVALVTVTGGLHQDGLADTLDALAGGKTPADRLRIMRDPCVGAVGATGLILDLALRWGGLQVITDDLRAPVLLCMPMFGRWGIAIGAWRARYARADGGVAGPFLAAYSSRHLLAATTFAVLVAVWQLGWVMASACCGVTILIARGAGYGSSHLVGGLTGDVLGAINELVEIAFLLLPFWSAVG